MKIKFPALVALLMGSSLTAMADSVLTTMVDGVSETRELVKMTFDAADPATVTLHFADNSTLVADIALVNVAIDHTGGSAIDEVIAASKPLPGVYNLKGERVAETLDATLAPGVYINNGRKILVK